MAELPRSEESQRRRYSNAEGRRVSRVPEMKLDEIRRLSVQQYLGLGSTNDGRSETSLFSEPTSENQSSSKHRHWTHDAKGHPYPVKFKNEFHKIMFDFTESKTFGGFILLIILLNTIILIASTWIVVTVRANWYFSAADNLFLGVYIMEIVLKLFVWRAKFFNEGWNLLDLTIVVFNTVDFALPLIVSNVGGFNGAAIFRLLRIFRAVRAIRALRVLRTIRFLANLQVIMTTLLQSIRSIGAIVMLISLVMYMFAVIGRGLYADADPKRFGNMFKALFTLFQLLTLDDWFEIYLEINASGSWHILLYLMLYIVMEYFIFLNLFVAVLVDNFQLTLEAQNEANRRKRKSQEESDDEEDYGIVYETDGSGSDTDSNISDDLKTRKSMNESYPGLSEDSYETLRHYFRLLTSMEYNQHVLSNQQRVLDMMVDMCVDSKDDM